MTNHINLPFTPEAVRDGTASLHRDQWDTWYKNLPDDLRRKLSTHDFKRLGDGFKTAFGIVP